MPGPTEVRFNKGEMVSKVFPGLLTVSLLAVESLPTVLVRVFAREKVTACALLAAGFLLALSSFDSSVKCEIKPGSIFVSSGCVGFCAEASGLVGGRLGSLGVPGRFEL